MRSRGSRPGRVARAAATRFAATRCAAALAAASAIASLPAAFQSSPDPGWSTARSKVQYFSVPVTRDAAELATRALSHMQAERWSEAVDDLQRLVVDHRGDLLPDLFDEDAPASVYRLHAGASEWAIRLLGELPPEARDLYARRYAPYAGPALERAVRSGERRDLVEVAQTWPIAPAARRAWWMLGDLELELGHVEEALRCWNRARELAELEGLADPPGALTRFDAARKLLRGDPEFDPSASDPRVASAAPSATPGGLYLPGPGEARGPVPQRDADEPWRYPLPDNPYERDSDAFTLYPVLAGDRLLVNTSLRVACVDAYSGRELWVGDEPPGWDSLLSSRREDFFDGLDKTNAMIACAASSGVVVAPLQIPYQNLPNNSFQGIVIMVTIPERRLFAYDVDTGEPLWNHMPPEMWDGLSGSFEERTQICGPPVIAGSRVLVPSYRLHGRIDFHVACYELFSGELLWETGLISGQRELNMFGRHEQEFCAPPVRIEGDRVVALTQLGTVAALDLYTGRLLWESLYEQIPLPKNRSWRTQERQQYWRNSPPVVADGTVLVTPVDSDDLVAFDLGTGAQLWSQSHGRLRSPRGVGDLDDPNVLLGADHETIYLGGRSVVAVHMPGGVSSAHGGFQVEVLDDLRDMPRQHDSLRYPPRPVLGRDELLVPTGDYRLTVPRSGSGGRGDAIPWDSRQVGNALLGDGVLFTLNPRWLSGFYDWHILLRRAHARLLEDPDDLEATLSLGDLLGRKGRALAGEGNRSAALSAFQEARALLEPRIVNATDSSGALADRGAGFPDRRVSASLHRVLRAEAEVRASEADTTHALHLLERALPYAPSPEARRDTLFEQELLLRDREPERWFAVMAELADLPGDPSVPWERLTLESSPHPGDDPWLEEEFVDAPHEVPVGLWVLIHRSLARGLRGEAVAELEDLHAALARYGAHSLGTPRTVFDFASERIADRLESDGRLAYQVFEERADALLEIALESRESSDLSEVTRRYPHSAAAARAHRALLDWAFERGDAVEVASRVYHALGAADGDGPLRPGAHGSGSRDEGADLLWKLARSIESAGNQPLALALAREVADTPLGFDASDDDARAVEAARVWLDRTPANAALSGYDGPGFDASLRRVEGSEGKWEVLARVALGAAADAPPADVLVLASLKRLIAYSSTDPGEELWDFHMFESVTPAFKRTGIAVQGESIVVAAKREVVAIDVREGYQRWQFDERRSDVMSMTASDGVVLVLTQDARARHHLRALDAAAGIELWSMMLPPGAWLPPVHEGGRAVFLTQTFTDSARALVVDVLRGRIDSEIQLPHPTGPGHGAWIEGDTLLVPRFQSSRAGDDLVALDLRTGERRWGVELETWEHLHSVVRCEAGVYLLVFPDDPQAAGEGALLQLDPRLGATRSVMALGNDLVPLGWRAQDTVELDSPWMFLQEDVPGAADTPVVAVELPYGKRWVVRLPVPHEELLNRGLPMPAVSDAAVALSYATKGRGPRMPGMHLELVELTSGRRLDARKLSTDLGLSTTLSLEPLGPGLLLAGSHRHGGRVEVWKNRAERSDTTEQPR